MTLGGRYIVISEVFIRREPRIVENAKGGNRVGKLTVGTERQILEVVTNADNSTWGRVSDPDAAGVSQWVCIQGLNRTYMKLVRPDPSNAELSARLDALEARVAALEGRKRAK